MIKKLNLLRTLVMLSFLTLFALSCKKETESDNFLNEAQKWYLQSTLNSKMSLQSTGNAAESVTTKYMWNKSRYFTLSDGKEAAGTPIEITLGNKELAKGSYMLLVYKMNNVYNYKIIYDEKNNYFSDNLSNSEIEKTLNGNIKNSATKSLAKSKAMTLTKSGGQGKLMNHQISEEVCIDWYLVETITGPDGQVSVYETYLNSQCYTPGGSGSSGSGGTNQTQQIELDFGNSVSVDEGGGEEETSIIGADTYKVARRTWTFHEGYTYSGKSKEKLMVKVTDGTRTWHSVTHEQHYKVGGWALGNVEYFSVSVSPFFFTAGSTGNTTVEASYRVRLTPTVYNQNFDSAYKYSYATWNTIFQKTQ